MNLLAFFIDVEEVFAVGAHIGFPIRKTFGSSIAAENFFGAYISESIIVSHITQLHIIVDSAFGKAAEFLIWRSQCFRRLGFGFS